MQPFVLVIFGITSNLAQSKLIPALFDLENKGILPQGAEIVGVARSLKNKEEFLLRLHQILHFESGRHKDKINEKVFDRFQGRFQYVQGAFSEIDTYTRLHAYLEGKNLHRKIFYLATYPTLYETIFRSLSESGLTSQKNGWVRLMIEKPLGDNLSSARSLDALLHQFFSEEQIFRIDHYLAKETMQNILAFRFGNGLFRNLMNKQFVDHIQITMAEKEGIGSRGLYYDSVGAFKDVGQNHLLQMLVAATMNLPGEFSNKAVTKERIMIIESLVPIPGKLVLGQYEGYRSEDKVGRFSETDTYFAFKTMLDTETWRDVPIYIRSGKKLARSVAEIHVVFKTNETRLFGHLPKGKEPNVLTYRLQPSEGIYFQILVKTPGHNWELSVDHLKFHYPISKDQIPDAYEKLIVAVLNGDQTFFNDGEEIEAQWAFTDKMLKNKSSVVPYKINTWGPAEGSELVHADCRHWVESLDDF